jgi:hypothetical protein
MRRVAAAAALLLLLPGCGHSPKTLRERLPLMVLPKSAFGEQAHAFGRARPFGYLSNKERAASDFDPLVTPVSLERAGRVTGYARQFGPNRAQTSQAMRKRRGLLEVGSLVELYQDGASVSRQLRASVRDLRSLVGKPVRFGARLEGVNVVRLPGVGDEAVRLTLATRVSGVRVQATEVGFRAGRMAGVVFETRADSKNVDPEVTSLARTLEQQISRASS